ncbi:MAG: hypothetical protein ACPGEG_00085 [Salibacteraceae bacterium]
MRYLLGFIFIILCFSGASQGLYQQSGIIHTEVQMYTKDGVQINGTSKEMHIELPDAGTKMVILLDPQTIITDNIEFNEEMDNAILGNFKFLAEVDVSAFEYQSRYNEMVELASECEINNVTGNTVIQLVVNNKKTNSENIYIIVGKGEIDIEEYNLHQVFPNLKGELKFQFTQTIKVKYN